MVAAMAWVPQIGFGAVLSGRVASDDAESSLLVELSNVPSACDGGAVESGAIEPPEVQIARIEQDGFFRLKIGRPGPHRLTLREKNRVVYQRILEPFFVSWDLGDLLSDSTKRGAVPELHPRGVATIEGRVVGEEGDGLSEVYIWRIDRPECYTRTDEDGRFSLRAYPGGELAAVKDGYLQRTIRIPAETSRGVLFALEAAGASVRGSVVDVRNRPIANARVLPSLGRPVATDEKGRFLLAALPAKPQTLEIEVYRSGFSPGRASVIMPADEGVRAARVTLSRPREVTGRVVDGLGRALEGVLVSIHSGEARMEATSGKDGRFRLGPLDVAEYTAILESEGFATRRLPFGLPAGEGAHGLGALKLSSEIVLEGHVVDPDGNSVSAARVIVREEDEALWAALREGSLRLTGPGSGILVGSATTEGDGRFFFGNMSEGQFLAAEVSKPGYLTATERFRVEAEGDPVEIELSPGAEVEVRVMDQGGSPVPDAWLWWSSLQELSRQRTAQTDEEGKVTLTLATPAAIDLRVTKWGYAEWQSSVSVPSGVARSGVDVTLWPGSTLSGLVHDPEGRPVQGAAVRVLGSSLQSGGTGMSSSSGEYELSMLPQGVMNLQVSHRDYETRHLQTLIDAEEELLDVELVPLDRAQVSGFVLKNGLDAVSGARVFLTQLDLDLNAAGHSATTDAGGFFDLGSVALGRYRVAVASEDFVLDPRFSEVSISAPEILRLPLLPLCILEGRVTGLSGEAMSGVSVNLSAGDGSKRVQVTHEGSFVVELWPALWSLSAREESGGVSDQQTVVCEGGEALQAVLRF